MTIDEAIKKYRKLSNSDRTCYPEEAAQIAEWLEELKVYKEKEFDVLKQDGQLLYKQGVIDGYNKSIDDFEKNLIRNSRTEVIDGKITLIVTEKRIKLIAKQLKARSVDD